MELLSSLLLDSQPVCLPATSGNILVTLRNHTDSSFLTLDILQEMNLSVRVGGDWKTR